MTGAFNCTLAPRLSVRNNVAAVEFYKFALQAVEVFRLEDNHSVVARLSVGGADFWVSEESPEHGNFSRDSLNGTSARMVLTVADPDAFCARAVAHGASE